MNSIRRRCEVLFLIPSLRGGGAERVMVTLLRNLDRSKFKFSLAVIDMTDAVFAGEVPADVEIMDLRSTRVRSALPKIFSLIWRRRPDLVFSTLGHLNLALAVLRAFLPNRVRYIARETTVVSQLPGVYAVPRWWFWAYRRFYAHLDALVCQSEEMREDLLVQFGIPAAKAIVINNPVDIERVQCLANEPPESEAFPAAAEIHLVAAGSLTHVKGFDLLIEALSRLRERVIQLTILGEGPLLAELRRLAAARGLSERVTFAGFRKNPYAYFKRADAFVLSSRFEGFPNVVLESLACGTPVIATPSPGGVREILTGMEECILADQCSVEALARAIDSFRPGRRISADVLRPYAVPNITAAYERLFMQQWAAEDPSAMQTAR